MGLLKYVRLDCLSLPPLAIFHPLTRMDPSPYSGSRYSAYNSLGPLQLHLTDLDFERYQPFNRYPHGPAAIHVPTDYPPSILPTQYPIPYNPVSTLPVRGDWYQFPTVWPII